MPRELKHSYTCGLYRFELNNQLADRNGNLSKCTCQTEQESASQIVSEGTTPMGNSVRGTGLFRFHDENTSEYCDMPDSAGDVFASRSAQNQGMEHSHSCLEFGYANQEVPQRSSNNYAEAVPTVSKLRNSRLFTSSSKQEIEPNLSPSRTKMNTTQGEPLDENEQKDLPPDLTEDSFEDQRQYHQRLCRSPCPFDEVHHVTLETRQCLEPIERDPRNADTVNDTHDGVPGPSADNIGKTCLEKSCDSRRASFCIHCQIAPKTGECGKIMKQLVAKLLSDNYILMKKLYCTREDKDKFQQEVNNLREKNQTLENALSRANKEANLLRKKLPNPQIFCSFTVTNMCEKWVRALEEGIKRERKQLEETVKLWEESSKREHMLSRKVSQLEGTLFFYKQFSKKTTFRHGFPEDVKMPDKLDILSDDAFWKLVDSANQTNAKEREVLLEENAVLRETLTKITADHDTVVHDLQQLQRTLASTTEQNENLKRDTDSLLKKYESCLKDLHLLRSSLDK